MVPGTGLAVLQEMVDRTDRQKKLRSFYRASQEVVPQEIMKLTRHPLVALLQKGKNPQRSLTEEFQQAQLGDYGWHLADGRAADPRVRPTVQ
jgi:hypothetical protein